MTLNTKIADLLKSNGCNQNKSCAKVKKSSEKSEYVVKKS